MEQYKKAVKRRLLLCVLLAIITLALSVYLFLVIGSEHDDSAKTMAGGFLAGFPCGICLGIFILSIAVIFRSWFMLRDEKKLRLGYNRDNDERMKLIRAKAGYPFSVVTAVIMIIAGLLLAQVNMTVSLTAIACACGQLIVSLVFKAVYSKIL
ncbi:MAG: hypothetical protein NC319_04775 [Butyricicoccus sp.]|nr:hypothetical protein [Butyricicoccus sp.]